MSGFVRQEGGNNRVETPPSRPTSDWTHRMSANTQAVNLGPHHKRGSKEGIDEERESSTSVTQRDFSTPRGTPLEHDIAYRALPDHK